ncbi:4'-phosphopantetheinyl transferase family protein [Cellulosimicrobium composti]|uniref:4'-phosphopantetheinyl transferase family protein n=1 Tax=Cellulosimicrobium composti TaxID=2672572 RepID=UPI0037937BE9
MTAVPVGAPVASGVPTETGVVVEAWLVDTAPHAVDRTWRAVGQRSARGREALVARLGGAVLGPDERTRALRLASDADAARYVRAHVAARELLAAATGLRPADVRWEVGRHGRPGPVVGQRWNLSRSGDHALVALAPVDVGVDVQVRDPRVDVRRLAARFLAPERGGHGDAWQRLARLEACAKAVGGRLLDVLGLDVRAPGLVRAAEGPWCGQEWWVGDVPAPAGAVAACATPGPRPHTVVVRQAGLTGRAGNHGLAGAGAAR